MNDTELIAKWWEKIRGGQEYMRDYASPNNWQLYRNYYAGEFDSGSVHARKYSVALIFSIIRAMVPRVYFTNPSIVATNEVPGYYFASKLLRKIDNKMIREAKLKHTLKEAIRDAGLCGTVPLLSGFDTEFGYDPAFKETVTNPETGQEEEIGGTLLQFDQKSGNKLEYNERIKPGKPWTDNIRTEFFIVPYGYSRLWKMPWVARVYIRPLEDVKLDKRLSNTKDLKANGMSDFNWFQEQQLHQKMSTQDKNDYVFLWEIRDLRTKRLMILQEGYKKFLYNEVDYLQKFGNPYNELTFNYAPLTFWGYPDAKYLEDSQLALNETRTIHMQTRRIAKTRFVYDENLIEPEEVQKTISEDVGAGIKANGDIDKAIKPFSAYVSPDFNIDVEAIRKDAREISGLSRNQVGEFEGGRKTATESNIVNMAAQIRVSERKDMVADLLIDIVQKYNKYIFSEWNVSQVEDIVGPDGKRHWVSFNHKQIDSSYAFRIDPESGQPISSDQKKQEAIQAAQYIQQSPVIQQAMMAQQAAAQAGQQPKPLPYNLEALDRYVLSQFDTVPIDEIMPPTAGIGLNPETPIPLEELQKQFKGMEGEGNVPIQR